MYEYGPSRTATGAQSATYKSRCKRSLLLHIADHQSRAQASCGNKTCLSDRVAWFRGSHSMVVANATIVQLPGLVGARAPRVRHGKERFL